MRPGTSDIIRCVIFDCSTSHQDISYKVASRCAVLFDSHDKVTSNTSFLSVVESLQSVGGGEGSFTCMTIVQPYQEQDVMEEDEDAEDGIRFASLGSRVENKETVRNW